MASIGQAAGDRLIRIYQRHISKDYNGRGHASCIYHPSCSEFSRQAVESFGLRQGAEEGALRVLRCNHEARRRHEAAFVESVRGGDLSGVQSESQGAADIVARLGTILAEEAQPGADSDLLRHEREACLRQVQIRLEEPPEGGGGKFMVRERVAPDTAGPSILGRVAGGLGSVLGGVVGAYVGGVAGVLLGGFIGASAGTGGLQRYNARVAEKWPESLDGVKDLQRPLAFVGSGVRGLLPLSIVAAPLGMCGGAIAGGVLGALAGIRTGARMGGALGRSVL
jgi:putative component of membrane protein insertase Oxa1/YidC/SpoIIIJ protein YidD